MTPTEREKLIQKEAENIVNEHYINKDAEAYADSIDRRGCAFWRGLHMGYIAGATALHDKARNQAIDEAIEKIQIKIYNHPVNKDNVSTLDECIAVLESLKTIS